MLAHAGRCTCRWSGFPSWGDTAMEGHRLWDPKQPMEDLQLGKGPSPREHRWSQMGCCALTPKHPRLWKAGSSLLTPNLNDSNCLLLRHISFSLRTTFSLQQTIRSIGKPCVLPPSKSLCYTLGLYFLLLSRDASRNSHKILEHWFLEYHFIFSMQKVI